MRKLGMRGRRTMSALAVGTIAALASLGLGFSCVPDGSFELPGSGHALFTSPQADPLALSADGKRLYVANTTSGSVSVLDVTNPAAPVRRAEIKVGVDPVGIAVRPKLDPANPAEDELIFVTNHISDSISVISARALDVVQTIQGLDAEGVTTTDEPVGIVFAGPSRAFVTLDQPNQVLVLDLDAAGRATLNPTRLQLTAQAPRALAVRNGRLYVAAFESGNQTEFPACSRPDTLARGLDESDDWDEGCEFDLTIIDTFRTQQPPQISFGPIFDFAAVNPNLGGRVIRDRDLPDRDLFVYDATTLAPLGVVEGVGTLLYGMVASGAERVYVTNTDGRNHLDGLNALGNRMFENRLSYLDCPGGVCSAPVHVDLDAAAGAGVAVPTPYGVALSGDGSTLVVTAAGSDGTAPGSAGKPAGQPEIPGLVTLDAVGNVLGSLRLGAIPQGVALRSGAGGAPETAFVLNTVDSSVSVVDVASPTNPALLATVTVGSDPTPPEVKRGRIIFSSARGSTSGTFSCESCHPNGNTDQLLWVINTPQGPDDPAGANGEIAEPRSTMPVRGLRDTLPVHWDGSLADPFPGTRPTIPGDTAPDCDLAVDGEVGCLRHLVNASLRGVMCDQSGAGCPSGPAGPGAFTDAERNDMAAFLAAVSYPPSPRRRPTDALSEAANLGVQDFFTDEDGLGIGFGIGQFVNFAPITCSDNAGGCHALPLTVSTNSRIVGGFDSPSIRGMWDRFMLFSNGVVGSQEALETAQQCAQGNPPGSSVVTDDPCDLNLASVTNGLIGSVNALYPSGEQFWDPADGMTERAAHMATFELIFSLVYGVGGANIWEYINEMSVGLPGLTGRQLSVTPGNAHDAETVAAMDQIEAAAREGRVTAVARNRRLGEYRFDPTLQRWSLPNGFGGSGEDLRGLASDLGQVLTVTAELPPQIVPGGPARQPLLSIDPDDVAVEELATMPAIPQPDADHPTFRLHAQYVDPAAKVYVNGSVCDACSFTPGTAGTGDPIIVLTLVPVPPPGTHVVQVLNPGGYFSNEMPIIAR